MTNHCLPAFAYLGVPERLKTDNGPAYVNITHKVKPIASYCKTKEGEFKGPITNISYTLCILNFLTVDDQGQSAMSRHRGRWSFVAGKVY